MENEKAVRTSAERYRTLLDSVDEGFYFARAIFDEEGRCIDIVYDYENPAAVRMIGQSANGRKLSDLGDYEDHWREIFGSVARTGEARRVVNYSAPDGIWFDYYVFKPPSAGPDELVVVFRDVTERKRAEIALEQSEERQSFLLKLSDALRPLADPAAIRSEACKLLGEQIKADWVVYGLIDKTRDIVDIDRGYVARGDPPITGEQRLSDFAWALPRYTAGTTVVVSDTQSSDGIPVDQRPAIAAIKMVGLISVPLIKNRRLVGALAVSQAEPRTWTWAEVRLVEETAERIWEAIGRANAEAALTISEERHAFLLRLSDTLRPLCNPTEIAAAASEALGRHLTANQVIYAQPDSTGDYVTITREWNDGSIPSNAHRHRLDDFGPLFIADLKRGHTIAIADVAEDPRTSSKQARATFAQAAIRSFVNVPLIKNERLVAVLGIHSKVARGWRDQEITIAEDVAERVWSAVERARSEAALRASEERLRLIIESAQDYAIFTTDPQGRITGWYSGAQNVFGWSEHDTIGEDFAMTFTAQDREEGHPAKELKLAKETGRAANVRWHCRSDASKVFIEGFVAPLRSERGDLTGFLKIGQDVTERMRSLEHERMLIAELQHRVRNTLAVVRSIARRTAKTSATVDAYNENLQGRLEAFSRVQAVVTRDPGKGVDLASLVADELFAHAACESSTVRLTGERVLLEPTAAESVSLAVHELTTNAMKYGALFGEDGQLDVSWRVDGEAGSRYVYFVWAEHGITPPRSGHRKGFGSELLLRSLPYELGAETRLDFGQREMRFEMKIPADRTLAIGEVTSDKNVEREH